MASMSMATTTMKMKIQRNQSKRFNVKRIQIKNCCFDHRKIVEQFDPRIPIEKAVTPPSSWYTHSSFLSLELDRVFYRGWLAVGLYSYFYCTFQSRCFGFEFEFDCCCFLFKDTLSRLMSLVTSSLEESEKLSLWCVETIMAKFVLFIMFVVITPLFLLLEMAPSPALFALIMCASNFELYLLVN